MELRRILVTGACGRVAAQLLPALQDRWDLLLLDRSAKGGDDLAAPLLIGELTEGEPLGEALDGVDAVVHLAGNPDPQASWRELREPNVEGFSNLLQAARDRGVRRVVYASSVHAMGAYDGRQRWPIDPAWPPAPCCSYGATKAFDEALAGAYDYRADMSLIGLRLGRCAEDATPAQAAAGWLHPADLRQIVIGALSASVQTGVYNAVSWGSRRRWNIDRTMTDLGYEPVHQGQDDPPDPGKEYLVACRR